MSDITHETLRAYLDEALSEPEMARIEQELRDSEVLCQQLRLVIQERDRGEHSVGAIWRRQRLSCPSREQLGSFLLNALDPDHHDYIEFHLRTIACPFCQANLSDLQSLQKDATPTTLQRRRRIYESSAGLLQK